MTASCLLISLAAVSPMADPLPLAVVNTDWIERDPWLSPDGYTLYFASNRKGGDFDLYQTQWDGRQWSVPEPLGPQVNSDFDETQPSLSDDGQWLLFISHRGRFWRGIWLCRRQPDGAWGQAEFIPVQEQPHIDAAVIGRDGRSLFYKRLGKGVARNDRRWDMRMEYDPGLRFWTRSAPYDGELPANDGPGARWRFVSRDGDIHGQAIDASTGAGGDAREVLNALAASSLYGGDDEISWVSEAQNLVDGLDDTSWISQAGMPVHRQWVLLALNGRVKYVPGLSRIHSLRIHTGPVQPLRIEESGKSAANPPVVPDRASAGTRPVRLRILGGVDLGQLAELAVAELNLDSGSPWQEIRFAEPAYLRFLRIEILATADPSAPYVAFNEIEAYGAGLSAPRPVHRVTTDENNNILVDGKPFFPVYIYDAKAESRLAEYGFNTALQTYDVAPDSTRLAILDRAEDLGFMVIGHVPWVDTEWDRKRARNQLLALKHHPALLGYLMSDEAGHSQEIMDRDKRRSDFIHQHDPDHFTMLNDLYPTYYPRSSSFVDVFSIDPYPHIVGQPYTYQALAVDTAYECVRHKKPVFVVNASWGRIISPVENRLNVYLALIHGAKGISWFALGVRWEDPDHWASILRCTREIQRLEPVLFAPATEPDSPLLTHSRIENPGVRIDVLIRQVGDEVWMLAANCEPRQGSVCFSFGWAESIVIKEVMTDLPEAWSLKRHDFTLLDPWPPPEDREPVRAARPIELSFEPYEVRVFRMKPAGAIGPVHEPVGQGHQLATINESLLRRAGDEARKLRAEGKRPEAEEVIRGFWTKYAGRVSVDDFTELMEILEDDAAPQDIVADYARIAEQHPEAKTWSKWVFKIVQAAVRAGRRDVAETWMHRLIERDPDSLWRTNAEVLVDSPSARAGRKPWIAAVRIDAGPRIDAELDEAIWNDRVSFKNTVYLDSSKHPQDTEFAAAYDEDAIYFCIRAIEPEPAKILNRIDKDDRSVWADDSVVVYLDPELDYFDYQQFIFNASGVMWDGVANHLGTANANKLNAAIERKAAVKDGAWQIEIRMPFKELGLAVPTKGQVWGLGLQRWRHVEGALPTVWGNERGVPLDNRPEQFGFLVFE